MTQRPKTCRACKRELRLDKVHIICDGELVAIEPSQLKGKCICGEKFVYQPGFNKKGLELKK